MDAYKKMKVYEKTEAYIRHLLPYLHLPGERPAVHHVGDIQCFC